jgi:hypothetical protein
MTNFCQYCKLIFLSKRRSIKFCSKKCCLLSRIKNVNKKCLFCKVDFIIKPFSKKKYCSQKCYLDSIKNKINKKCLFCNKDLFVIKALIKRKNYCSRKCYTDHKSILVRGKNNPAYKNGSSYNKRSYRGENWESIRLEVYKRDDFTCQECKTKCISKKRATKENSHKIIQCHHKVKYSISKDNSLSNLETLCLKCHLTKEQKC